MLMDSPNDTAARWIKGFSKASIGAQHLAVDPPTVGPQGMTPRSRYLRLAQPFSGGTLLSSSILRLSLALEKELGPNWTGCHGVYGDFATAQLVGRTWTSPSTPALEAMYAP